MNEYLHNLQQYVLKSDTHIIRDAIYDFMTITSIVKYGNAEHSLESAKIIQTIENHFNVYNINFQITESLKRLSEDGKITPINKHTYSVSKSTYEDFLDEETKTGELEENVRTALSIHIKKSKCELEESVIKKIIINFFNLLDKTFQVYGSYAVRLFSDSQNNSTKSYEYEGFMKIFEQTILSIIPKNKHNSVKNSFNDFFTNPSKQVSQFLFSRAISYVIPKVVNANPKFQNLSKQSFEKKLIILDTNIIVDLLVKENNIKEALKTLLKNTQSLGMKIGILDITCNEFLRLVDSTKANQEILHNAKKYGEDYEDPFYSAFLNRTEKKGGFSDFLAEFEKIEYELKNAYNITKITSDIDNATISEELLQQISNATSHRNPNRTKTRNAQIHDGKCIEFVRKYRESIKTDETGPSCWFLTMDNTLRTAENNFYADTIIANITTAAWLQMITPFMSMTFDMDMTEDAFSKLIGINFIVNKVDPVIFTQMFKIIPELKNYSEETIKEIIGDEYIRSLFVKLEKAEENRNEKEKKKSSNEIIKELKKYTDSKIKNQDEKIKNQDEKIKKLEEQNKNQHNELSELSIKISWMSNKNKFLKWLLITAVVLTFIFILLYTYSFPYVNIVFSITLSGISIFFGVWATKLFSNKN